MGQFAHPAGALPLIGPASQRSRPLGAPVPPSGTGGPRSGVCQDGVEFVTAAGSLAWQTGRERSRQSLNNVTNRHRRRDQDKAGGRRRDAMPASLSVTASKHDDISHC